MKPWINVAITRLLRTGVTVSVILIAAGIVITFVHHRDYFSSRPALGSLTSPGMHFPSSLGEVVAGVLRGSGQAIMAAGLLVLIGTPVARVGLSVVIFIVERDWLYAGITLAVFLILLVSFAVGRGGG